MPIYVIVEVEVISPAEYDKYKKMVPPSIAAYGGKLVVRGGTCETLEGSWRPQRVIVIEFTDMARAKQWWSSPEYRDAKAIRQRSANTRMIAVEGIR